MKFSKIQSNTCIIMYGIVQSIWTQSENKNLGRIPNKKFPDITQIHTNHFHPHLWWLSKMFLQENLFLTHDLK